MTPFPTPVPTPSPMPALTPARFLDAFSAFIDLAAAFAAGWLRRLRRGAPARIVEAEGGRFVLEAAGTSFRLDTADDPPAADIAAALAGREVELALDPDRFLFRPLELPKGAAAFLDGIVRAQIDRLTPWSAADAAYGFVPPADAPDERITVLVAATARARVIPLVERLKALGAGAIVVTTRQEPAGAPVRVLDLDGPGAWGAAGVRRVLLAVLGGTAVAATLALATAQIAGAGLDAEREDLLARAASQRRAIVAAREGQGGQGGQGGLLRALERRKREVPAGVLVLEALAQVLPDDTYVTELQMDGDRMEVAGVSRQAPALIRLMEQSRHFAEATFVAPTTRQPGEAGERFHIAARILLPMEAIR